MMNVKVVLTLIAGSSCLAAMLLATSPARAESDTQNLNPQFIEIVRQPRSVSPHPYTSTRLSSKDDLVSTLSDDALINDDKIGEAAIKKYGCDCAGCRRVIAQILQQ
jgi:hypothetical protein